jgi:hypothetical protein
MDFACKHPSIASASRRFGNLEKLGMRAEWTVGSALSSLQVASLQVEWAALDFKFPE